jgi:hypothetical protein
MSTKDDPALAILTNLAWRALWARRRLRRAVTNNLNNNIIGIYAAEWNEAHNALQASKAIYADQPPHPFSKWDT